MEVLEGEELKRAVLNVLSVNCSFDKVSIFFNKGQRLYQRRVGEGDQKEIPCKFDVFHPFLQQELKVW